MSKALNSIILVGLLLISLGSAAQCPTTFQINTSPALPVCRGTQVTFTATATAGSITTYIWVVNGDTVASGASISTSEDFSHIELYAVSDACPLDTTQTSIDLINVIMSAEYTAEVTECNQPVADIEILSVSGTPDNSPYSWELITAEGSKGEKEVYYEMPISSYPLVITDAIGCMDTTYLNMEEYICPPPRPTEVITPNEDGRNDYFRIFDIEYYPNNSVYIFDRWGQRVYHKNGYVNSEEEGFTAKYLGLNLPVSTYYYILKIKNEKSDDVVFKGAISVFR